MQKRNLATLALSACFLTSPLAFGKEPPAGLQLLDEELPEVTIVHKVNATHTEFRLRNKLYMIKVTPKNAPPYYLIDNEGRGAWIRAKGPVLVVPSWAVVVW